MHLVTKNKTAALALAATTVWAAPLGLAQGENTATRAQIAALIDPAPPGAQTDDSPSSDEMKRVVRELIDSGNGERVQVFGESAGPAMRAIVDESGLKLLTRPDAGNPLFYLVEYAPLEALQFFSDAERLTKFKYDAIVRGEFGPLALVGTNATKGGSRELFLDLMDRTIASETLSLEIRLKLAVGALNDDLATPESKTLIRANADLAVTSYSNWAPYIIDIVLSEESRPVLSEAISRAVVRWRPSIETYEAFAGSPHAKVRVDVADGIGDFWSELPTDRVAALLTTLLQDEDPDVARESDQSIERITQSDSFRLDLEVLTRLVAAIGARTNLSDGLCSQLAQTIHRTAQGAVDADSSAIGDLYRAAFEAPNPRLHRWLRKVGTPTMAIDHAVAYYAAAAPLSQEARSEAMRVVGAAVQRIDARSPVRAAATLDVLANEATLEADAESLLSRSTYSGGSIGQVSGNQLHRQGSLSSLPPTRVAKAIRWFAEAGSAFDSIAFTSSAAWKDAGPALRGVVDATGSSTRERLLAGSALVMSGIATDEDVDTFANILIDLSANAAARDDIDWYLSNRSQGSTLGSGNVWNRVALALLEDARVPAEIADTLSLTGPAQDEDMATMRAVLVAAERRAATSTGLQFKNMAYHGLRAMIEDPSLVQPNLLRRWLVTTNDFTQSAVTVILATGDPAWAEFAMNALLARVAAESSFYRQMGDADQLLRLPGDEPVARLLDIVMRSGSTELVTHVEQRVAELLRIREASLRWSQLASGGTDLESAKAQVLGLLDAANADVRVEAIRALGTLGAVEALPRLITIVGSENEAERKAAKETLEMLRQRAALQAPEKGTNDD